jgi:hypothetical protein
MTRWERFKCWLFPPYAKCMYCGSIRSKSRMYKNVHGYFCNEEESTEHWFDMQI